MHDGRVIGAAAGLAAVLLLATGASGQSLETPTYATDDPGAVRAARTDPFCRDVLALMKPGRNGYTDFKGAYRTDYDEWVSTELMPGADKCTIKDWRTDSTEYSCSWKAGSVAEANRTGYQMARRLRWCAWYALDYGTGDVAAVSGAPFEHRMLTHEDGMDYIYKIRTYAGRQTEVMLGVTAQKRPDPKESMPDEFVQGKPGWPR